MDLKQNTQKKIEELQLLESHLQGFLAQKQSVQIELNEINNALGELDKSEGDVYKVVSGFMLKSTKETLSKELGEKKKMLDMRKDSMEKQEALLEKNISSLKEEVEKTISQTEQKKK